MLLVSRWELVNTGKKIPYLFEVLVALDDGHAEGVPPLPCPGGDVGGILDSKESAFATCCLQSLP